MADRVRRWLFLGFGWLGLLGAGVRAHAGDGPTLKLDLDARELPRHLVHSRIEVPCKPGKLALWYPKWIPGTHAPCGPVRDQAGLRVETKDGKAVPWRRDEADVYRIECEVPQGIDAVVVRLDMICNTAADSASGYLTYGNESVGIINWPTCLMYPEGPTADDTQVAATLRLPKGWKLACALKTEAGAAGQISPNTEPVRFQTVSLTKLCDNPVIGGEHMSEIPLRTAGYPPAFLQLASESASGVEIHSNVNTVYSRVVQQAGAMFGTCHYPTFHFLVTCSDDLGYLGLEHLECSINGVHENELTDARMLRGWVGNLLPHEYVHSWCGKFRRPAGMCTPNFHTPQKTSLLWVYEGLTEYLGEVLMVRSGMISQGEYRMMLAGSIGNLKHQAGRRWRSLEDTAIASYLLRDGSPNWNELRRSQDYYHEGALVWLEVDAIIREKTRGKHSLDDFCRKFLGMGSTPSPVVPYEFADVVRDLKEVCDYDWDGFLRSRVARPLDSLPLEVVPRLGYKVTYSSRTPPFGPRISRRGGGGGASARDSLGLSFDGDGKITDVIPGMVGDRAGLGPGMKVIGVNDTVFSAGRLQEALVESVKRKKIEFLIVEGEHFRRVVLDYAEGPKYLEVVRDWTKPDLLSEILKPLDVPKGKK